MLGIRYCFVYMYRRTCYNYNHVYIQASMIVAKENFSADMYDAYITQYLHIDMHVYSAGQSCLYCYCAVKCHLGAWQQSLSLIGCSVWVLSDVWLQL